MILFYENFHLVVTKTDTILSKKKDEIRTLGK
jgi:hypothetical protein